MSNSSTMRAVHAESFTGYTGLKLVQAQDLRGLQGGYWSGSQQRASPPWTIPSCRAATPERRRL